MPFKFAQDLIDFPQSLINFPRDPIDFALDPTDFAHARSDFPGDRSDSRAPDKDSAPEEVRTGKHEQPWPRYYACRAQRITSGIEAFLPYISMPMR